MDIPLYTSQLIRQCEQLAITSAGITEDTLMQRAADAAFAYIKTHIPSAKRIVICCGQGNNGGDGYVLASLLKQANYLVSIVHTGDIPQANIAVARHAIEYALKHGVSCQAMTQIKPVDLSNADLLVDAILGTGVNGAVRTDVAKLIDLINAAKRPILALDSPSGLNPDTGSHNGNIVNATETITFIGYKIGLFTGDGVHYAGKVQLADLQLPTSIFDQITSTTHCIDWQAVQSQLPNRARTIHKGNVGHVLVIGGNYGMGGAAALAAQAAYRVGAGLVSVATRAQHVTPLLSHMPELMVHAVNDTAGLTHLLERATVIALGPGLGDDQWANDLFKATLATNKPCIIDADGLNQLAKQPTSITNAILTPHPGEAARLLNCNTDHIQHDRINALHKLIQRYQATVVLKGAGTLIGTTNTADTTICCVGNPGMATGGMGDVLSGVIAGLYAQGLNPYKAACIGVCAHGYAGDLAARSGERGLIASDLLPYLKQLMG